MSVKPVSSPVVVPAARPVTPPSPAPEATPTASAPATFDEASPAPVALGTPTAAVSDGTVTLGSRGPEVTRLKTLLRDAGFYDGVINDEMGSMGVDALKRAKQALQLTGPVDVAGPTTVAALERAVARRASQPGSVPVIDQHRMNSPNADGYCGVASTLMAIGAVKGQVPVDVSNAAALKRFGDQMYLPGQGSSGAAMAQVMRNAGLGAEYDQRGTVQDIVRTLQSGQPVPLGVESISGTVMSDVNSARYGALRAGERHDHRYGPSGHWVAVTGFEGPANNPTHFIVNDPDTGARLRMTRAEVEKAAVAPDMWMIHNPAATPRATRPAEPPSTPSTGTPSTGTPSTGTPSASPAPGTIGPGSKGPEVRELKTLLKNAGFYDGVLNDEMGPMGVDALKRAKQALQLGGPADVAGPTTIEALRRAGASQDFGAQLRSGDVSKTPIYLAIGLAEGTIGADGKPTSAYFGHGDPGNGALNRGFGSYQVRQDPRGASLTPAQADRIQADRLAGQWPAIDQALTRAGIAPGPTRNLIAANALDGWNQAPATFNGTNGLLNPNRLAELKRSIDGGRSPIDAIVDWRANSYREDNGVLNAPGLGNSMSRVRDDQRRRAEAVAQGLSIRGTTSTTPTTPTSPTTPTTSPTPSQAPISTRLLSTGATGDDVQRLQQALNRAGAAPRLAEDGDFGAGTEAAVRVFQQRAGLDVDGVAGPQTLAKLASPSQPPSTTPAPGASPEFNVRPGSKGPQVRELKEALKAAGYYSGVINDEMGPDGVAALKKAKAALRLGGPADVAGPTTLEALKRAASSPVAGSPVAISERGRAQMSALIEHARANHQGASKGDCFQFVWGYMTKSGYGKLDNWNDLPGMDGALARGFPDFLNASQRNLDEAGLQRLDTATQPAITNPHDPRIPPGAVIVVAPGSTGTSHPTAGDIVVKGTRPGEFINDGPNMNYGTRDSWRGRILGVYVPR